MGFRRASICVTSFTVILMAILPTLLHSSRLPHEEGMRLPVSQRHSTNMASESQRYPVKRSEERMINGGGEGATLDDSAREVPTGPDPLHHHSFPSSLQP
ncbi:hypothetical protein Ancab_024716 [Ancistrocladus abbreviatus]